MSKLSRPHRVRFRTSPAFEEHLRRMRAVNPAYRFPLVDFWSPGLVDALEDLSDRSGRVGGYIDGYRVEYFEGRDLPVEANIYDRETGLRIAQDGSADTSILTRLRKRLDEDG